MSKAVSNIHIVGHSTKVITENKRDYGGQMAGAACFGGKSR